MQEPTCRTPGIAKTYTMRVIVQHVVLLALFPALIIIAGPFLPIPMTFAADTLVGRAFALQGTAGRQQVSLSWKAASNATSYLIHETNLASAQTTQLSSVVTTTSYTLTGLQTGRWYRFTVTPVNDSTVGIASAPLEIRTKGFAGSYSHYYALGDSYTSGDGAPPYFGVKDCYRSTNSYPYRLGEGAPKPMMFACAGAITDNIDLTIQNTSLSMTQLDQLESSPRNNTLITITIGGNDVGFSSELTNCIINIISCATRETMIAQEITDLEPRLVQVYQELRDAAPGADIIAVGYPLLVADPTLAHCHNPIVFAGLSKKEMRAIRTLADQLDTTIAQAASQAGIYSATQQVIQAFVGHEACTATKSQEWINEIAGICDALSDSFHPNSAGYQAMAAAIDSARQSMYQSNLTRS